MYDGVGKDTFSKGLECLARRGYMILYGGASGPVPPVDPSVLVEKGSLYLHRPKLADFTATRQELTARSDELLGWVQSGKVRVTIAATFPLAEAAAAHRLIVSRKAAGKILLIP